MEEKNKKEIELEENELEENEIVRISIIRIPGLNQFSVHTAVCEEDSDANDIADTILEAIDDAFEDAVISNEED